MLVYTSKMNEKIKMCGVTNMLQGFYMHHLIYFNKV